MLTKVKVCGIKTEEEVQMINLYPVNYVGFIFAPSKRQVTEERAIVLRPLFRKDIKVVGVFVDEEPQRVNELIKSCSLDVVQLHGNETVEYCNHMQAKVWKTICVKDEDSLYSIQKYSTSVEGILLDTYSKDERGGTGKTFHWGMVKELSKTHTIILAGGLTPENIVQAIKTVMPQVVDLNSGLETNLMKDNDKISKLFSKLKEENWNE
ncbi:MAG: N-(5'-phosphoribosyl)anthranilate isomerase [Firmicutes bacterium HGW-Firmicutes-1]|jgi:phosphoribosylanthranilate isomerase|nr:MAG: N-(5'-phosphoribosyl)anthranilate isomerase [Firmicutes bacterium HGW-Firmicutes-1]